ncbi:MAG: YidC/Oxa1 family membrane protein insertase [Spirochaetia bacterium]|nr:YidC/Oxa1 family membrane protein insertase [Spirochaetia bacterium]
MNILYLIFIYPIELLIELVFQLTYEVTDNCGVSIAAVSLAVSFLSLPLYIIAERWQQKERDIQKVFRPEIDEIKAVFKGDERYMILSTFYRQNHYHPVMALRSSISLMIQVPFFIAAYVYLSNLEMLKGQSLWCFEDLGAPDALFSIGNFQVNVLPVAMTVINIIASAIYVKGFSLKEKIQLYGMAGLFLVLLYDSPAGLVFYWTLNNVFSLCKNICYKIRFREPECCRKTLDKFLSVCKKPLRPLYQENRARFLIFFFSCLILLFLVGAVIPSSLICSSVSEFSYIDPFRNPLSLLKFPFFQSLGITAWCIGLYFLFSRKTQTVFTFLMFSAAACALVNTYIFPGDYGTVLVDNGLYFENGLKIANELAKFPMDLLVLAIVFSAVLILFQKKKFVWVKNICALLVISLAAFSCLNIFKINSEFRRIDKIMMSEGNNGTEKISPVYHFSRTGKNIMVIMLDRGINSFFPDILEAIPDCREQFSGFVYYPDTVSAGTHTILAAPSLFGGYDYLPEYMNQRQEQSLIDKHNEALNVLPRFFKNNGYDITITDAPLANYSWIPDNSIFSKDMYAVNLSSRYAALWRKEHDMEVTGWKLSDSLRRNFLFFDFFRVCPVSLRGILYYHGTWWSSDADKKKDEYSTLIKWYSALDYLPELSDLEGDGDQYFAIENDTTHEPAWMHVPEYELRPEAGDRGENIFGSDVTFRHFHINAASIRMLGVWFQWMKDHGVYDNTRIIIASDHGRKIDNSRIVTDFDVKELMGYNALLLYKDFNAVGDVRTDDSFMCIADIPGLATDGICAEPANPFTGTLFSRNTKEQGILLIEGPVEANEHYKNAFKYEPKYKIKNSIFKAENWEVLK